jgi:hypothetical protein
MEKARVFSLYFLFGGASAWIPDIILHWLLPLTGIVVIVLTFVMPAVVALCWRTMTRWPEHSNHYIAMPLLMLLGAWFFGPPAIAVSTIPHGATFLHTENLKSFFLLWASFPLTTYMMSAYSGSLGGVILATIYLLARLKIRRAVGSN